MGALRRFLRIPGRPKRGVGRHASQATALATWRQCRAAISLSSGLASAVPHRYEAGKRQIEETFGIKVIETPNALRDDEWLYRNPEARADDLHWALENGEVRAIFSTIGGDESVREFGHTSPQMVIPIGCRASIDPETKRVRVLEAGVV